VGILVGPRPAGANAYENLDILALPSYVSHFDLVWCRILAMRTE
jgi:hypothetical protein